MGGVAIMMVLLTELGLLIPEGQSIPKNILSFWALLGLVWMFLLSLLTNNPITIYLSLALGLTIWAWGHQIRTSKQSIQDEFKRP